MARPISTAPPPVSTLLSGTLMIVFARVSKLSVSTYQMAKPSEIVPKTEMIAVRHQD